MDIKTYEPKHPILKKYIAYYYEASLEDCSYLAFPHYNLPVTIIFNSTVTVINNDVFLEENKKKHQTSFTFNKFKKPIKISAIGKIKEFSVVFKPYGLAQFLPNLLNWSTTEISVMSLFNDFLAPRKKINLDNIENYLISKLNEKEGTETVIKAVTILKEEEKTSLKELSNRCNCHQKKLYRLFKTICGDSPINFKKIIQFRKSLEKIKNTTINYNLTDIALTSDYYDQPAFNNAFKKLTGEKPSSFFKNIESFTTKKIYFKNMSNR